MTDRSLARLGAGAATVMALAILPAGCGGAEEDVSSESSARPVVWVANEGDDSLSVLDARTGRPLSTLTGVEGPHNVQASASGDRVWVTGLGGVIQIGSESLAVQHVSPAGEHPAHVVAGPDGVLVTSYGDGSLRDFTDELEPRGTHPLGGGPHGMRVAPDTSFVAVANNGAGTLDLVDMPLGQDGKGAARTRSVDVGPEPIQAAVSADSRTVFVAVAGSREVVRVDVATARVTGRVEVDAAPAQVWATGTGLVLAANQGTEKAPGSTLSVIDAETMRVVADVATGQGPHGIVVTPDDASAWVTNTYDDSVTLVDLETLEAVASYDVGDRPNGITLGRTSLTDVEAQTLLVMPPRYAPAEGHAHGGHDDEEPPADDHTGDQHGGDDHGGDDHGGGDHGGESSAGH